MSNRRLSSPYVLDRTGIVTASLKIPVQMQQTQTAGGSAVRDTFDDDEVFYLGSGQFDLSNIPYIEDSTTFGNDPGNSIEGFPITGSLLFGGGGGANADGRTSSIQGLSGGGPQIYQIPIAFEADNNISSAGESSHKQEVPFLSASLSKSTGTAAMALSSYTAPSSRSKEKKTVSLSNSQTVQLEKPKINSQDNIRQTIGQMEQKLPTSISNIGGAILRSKTADFERMASAGPALSAATAATTSSSSSVIDQNRSRHQTPGHSYDESNPRSQGQLYKRQALISSAKRK